MRNTQYRVAALGESWLQKFVRAHHVFCHDEQVCGCGPCTNRLEYFYDEIGVIPDEDASQMNTDELVFETQACSCCLTYDGIPLECSGIRTVRNYREFRSLETVFLD